MSIQSGKKPLSSKPAKATFITREELFGNTLAVDEAIQKEIESQGLTYRFISVPELQKMGGFHRNGWKPYKRKTSDTMSIQFGSDPEGYIRRGELVLAVRPKELTEKHREYLKQEAGRASRVQQTNAQSIRDSYSGRGIQVTEGYEDEGESDE